MKRHLFLSALLISLFFFNCKEENEELLLTLNDSLSFRGTFKTINSENLSGTTSLYISNGYYECFTNLPYGHGAGKIEANNKTINFIDTLFSIIPALYGPSYVLSGKHNYEFDGKILNIWRDLNAGSIEYNLEIFDCKNSHYGILKDLTGLSGCRWIIQLSDSTKLEPINLSDFNIELKDNQPVCFRFHEKIDLGSYCMVGKIVELDFIVRL